jgi:hypothetical protein
LSIGTNFSTAVITSKIVDSNISYHIEVLILEFSVLLSIFFKSGSNFVCSFISKLLSELSKFFKVINQFLHFFLELLLLRGSHVGNLKLATTSIEASGLEAILIGFGHLIPFAWLPTLDGTCSVALIIEFEAVLKELSVSLDDWGNGITEFHD